MNLRSRKSIRIHRRHQKYIGIIYQSSDSLIRIVVTQQIFTQINHELSSDRFVAVHIGHILKHGFQETFVTYIFGDFERPQIPVLCRLSYRVQLGQLGILALEFFEQPTELLVGLIFGIGEGGLAVFDSRASRTKRKRASDHEKGNTDAKLGGHFKSTCGPTVCSGILSPGRQRAGKSDSLSGRSGEEVFGVGESKISHLSKEIRVNTHHTVVSYAIN